MNKKLALNIREGVFFNDIEGYSIKVNRKDAEGRLLEDVLIYDHSEKMGNTKVIKAKRGSMYTSDSDRYLYLDLYDGYSYEEVEPKNPKKRIDSPFARSSFKSQKIRFDMASFQLERSDEERYSNVAQFMNLKQLQESSDSLNSTINKRINTFQEKLLSYYHFESLDTLDFSKKQAEVFSYSSISKNKQKRLTKAAANLVRSSKSYIYNSRRELKYKHKKLRKANVEWHRKFTLSFACIVLFLIGAPLGAIIRKGGMGMPVLISILFFLAYHISSITGEKSAIQGVLSIPFGMWLSAFILTPLGVFFTIRAASDSTLFEISLHKNLNMRIKELWNRKKS
jgi:lipopolysaccharide export system permease protein